MKRDKKENLLGYEIKKFPTESLDILL